MSTKPKEGKHDVEGFGIVHCCECETPIAYFKPEGFDPDADVELYCFGCASGVNTGGANG